MTKYLLAIDLGTSSARVIAYDLDGRKQFTRQYPFSSQFPQSGWVEQDAEEIWQTILRALKEVLLQTGENTIIACGLTNQRETIVAWDKQTGDVLAPAIVWQDRRTQSVCAGMTEHSHWVNEKTGLRIDPYFSASKIQWLLQHYPEWQTLIAQERLAIATMDAFLLWRLTNGNVYATDITNASRTLLMDIHTGMWDKALLDFWQVPQTILPEIKACDADFGVMDKQVTGQSIPITGVAGDQQAALIGQHCFEAGMAKATFGTGAFLMMNTGGDLIQSQSGLITTVAYEIQQQRVYALEGSIYHAGTTIKWLRDKLRLLKTASDSERMARELTNNGGVYLVSSYTGLGAPYWDATPGGRILGLSLDTSPAHIVRAALEGVTYQTRDVMASMQADMGRSLASCRVDGGMADNGWFLQFLADQCNCVIEKPDSVEITAKGAAMLAGIGAGVYHSLDKMKQLWQAAEHWQPSDNQAEIEKNYQGWRDALSR